MDSRPQHVLMLIFNQDPFSTSTRSSGSASPVKQSPFQPMMSQSRPNAPPSNAAIDLVIANAMANAPAPPHLGIMDQNARIGNESKCYILCRGYRTYIVVNRIRTPSAINNLFPAAVGIDGRVNLFVGNVSSVEVDLCLLTGSFLTAFVGKI